MATVKTWQNGRFVNTKNAAISISDRGFLYGDGIFETLRSYSGRIFKEADHLKRLYDSADSIGIKIPYRRKDIAGVMQGGLSSGQMKNSSIRIIVTRGEGSFTLAEEPLATRPNVIITMKRFNGYTESFYSGGISACVSDIAINESSPLSGIKSLNFLEHIMARSAAQKKGFDEAILVNLKGHVAEAATSNIFILKKDRLMTPSTGSGILPGITRGVVIEMAGKLGIKTAECAVTRDMLMHADEVFLTNSLAEMIPVVKIGHAVIGTGHPGAVTKLLHADYRKMV
ncbi:MAG: aminotransferase class IV [Candidatus Omnitrophica bacterium]|nr:aminotransferase class IV [Candidatus Omnitrophota bacterium]